jgi:hypothetical protein
MGLLITPFEYFIWIVDEFGINKFACRLSLLLDDFESSRSSIVAQTFNKKNGVVSRQLPLVAWMYDDDTLASTLFAADIIK